MLLLLAGFLVLVIAYRLYEFYHRISLLPPGPRPYPLMGNLFRQINPPMVFRDLQRLAKEYGSVFTFHMPFAVVNLSTYDALKEAMITRGEDFSGRMHTVVTEMITYAENGGIITSNGPMWKEQRRTALQILRDFGMGKNLMEEKVKLSAMEYLRCLKEQGSEKLKSINLRWPLQLFVANIINEFLFNYRYSYDNCQVLVDYVEGVQDFINGASKSALFLAVMRFPWLRKIPFIKEYAFDQHKRRFEKLRSHIISEISRAKESYHTDEEPQCFVHAYIQREKDNKNLTHSQLVDCCTQLFLAGQETTTTTLRWAMLFMAAHQDVQDKLREEILRVIGSDRLPNLSDKLDMPYTSATLHEIQRVANIVATNFLVMRSTTTDTEVDGHKLPAGTTVNEDLHQIHMTDPHFVEPEKFNPDRYLESNGVMLKKELVDRTVPFGMGKRQCAGEGLARVELFVGLVATVQNYRILPPVDGAVDLEPVYLNVHLPKAQKLRLEPV